MVALRPRIGAGGRHNLDYLRYETLTGVTALLTLCGLLGVWYVIWPRIPGTDMALDWLACSVVLLAGGLTSFLLRERRPRLVSYIALLTTLVAMGLTLVAGRELTLAYLFPLAVVLAGVLLGEHGIILAAVLSLILERALMHGMLRQPAGTLASLLPLFVLLMTAALSWMGARTLNTALAWFEQAYVAAQEHVTESTQRRGELRRTLDALEEASRRVQRTNDELLVARQVAEKERATKEQFVAHVSHELRTPLNLVVGFAEMLYLSPETYQGVNWTPELVSDIGEMYRAGRHLQNLVNDILDLSRIDAHRLPMHRDLLDLREIIQETMETVLPLFRQKGLGWWLELPEQPATVLADPVRLQQVLINLLNNAVRFTDVGSVGIRLALEGESYQVSVVDTGLGIPADQLDRVFQSFTQVNGGRHGRGGAGLGLAISQQLVRRHGGTIWVESLPGEGSIFCFTLPISTAEMHRELQLTPRREKQLDAPIILVEQDPEVGDLFGRHLGGRKVIMAGSPEEAECLVEGEHPAAVVVNLAPGHPHADWLGTLGETSRRFQVPIIRCSIPSAKWLSQATGLDDCLSKPITRDVLQRVIASHVALMGALRVLVVDDNTGFANLITRMLSTFAGVNQVCVAYSGLEALELVRQATPDLILLDIVMPGMSGFEVLDALRADPRYERIKVVAITSTSYSEELVVHSAGTWTLTHGSGLSADSNLDLLEHALRLVWPDYLGEASTPESA